MAPIGDNAYHFLESPAIVLVFRGPGRGTCDGGRQTTMSLGVVGPRGDMAILAPAERCPAGVRGCKTSSLSWLRGRAYTFARLELHHLRYFCVVAETLNVTEASRRLRVGQPSISRQIRVLERDLGQPLFHREKGRLVLTPAGVELRREAARVVADFDATLAAFRVPDQRGVRELHIGYYGVTWATLLAPALPRFRRLYPHVVVSGVELAPAAILSDLKHGALDLGVLPPGTPAHQASLTVQPIGAVPALVALSVDHPLAKRRKLQLAELREETFLTYATHLARGREQPLVAACRHAGFKPRLLREVPSLPALLLAIAQNRGIAVVTPFAQASPHPGVIFSRLQPPGVLLDLYVGYRHDRPEAVRKLAEFIATENRRRGTIVAAGAR